MRRGFLLLPSVCATVPWLLPCTGACSAPDAEPADASPDARDGFVLPHDDAVGEDDGAFGDGSDANEAGAADGPIVCPDADYYVTVNGDGPEQTYRSLCSDFDKENASYNGGQRFGIPIAVYFTHVTRGVTACATDASSGPADPSIHIGEGAVGYRYAEGAGWMFTSMIADASADVQFTQWGAVGGVVEGTYAGVVGSNDAGTLALSGSFRACRTRDMPPPP